MHRCNDHNLSVREANSHEELEAIGRLRYEIYVTEMGRAQQYADHRGKRILEPLDLDSTVYGFFDKEDHLQGSIRETCALSSSADYYRELYGIANFSPDFLRSTFIGTKFMLRRNFRNYPNVVSVLRQIFTRAASKGIQRVLLDVNEDKSKLYVRLGFRPFGAKEVIHPEYGPVCLMCLQLEHFPLGNPLLRSS